MTLAVTFVAHRSPLHAIAPRFDARSTARWATHADFCTANPRGQGSAIGHCPSPVAWPRPPCFRPILCRRIVIVKGRACFGRSRRFSTDLFRFCIITTSDRQSRLDGTPNCTPSGPCPNCPSASRAASTRRRTTSCRCPHPAETAERSRTAPLPPPQDCPVPRRPLGGRLHQPHPKSSPNPHRFLTTSGPVGHTFSEQRWAGDNRRRVTRRIVPQEPP
jgi:hypothetical protein